MDPADQAVLDGVMKRLEEKYAAELASLKQLLAIPDLIPALSTFTAILNTDSRQDRGKSQGGGKWWEAH